MYKKVLIIIINKNSYDFRKNWDNDVKIAVMIMPTVLD